MAKPTAGLCVQNIYEEEEQITLLSPLRYIHHVKQCQMAVLSLQTICKTLDIGRDMNPVNGRAEH